MDKNHEPCITKLVPFWGVNPPSPPPYTLKSFFFLKLSFPAVKGGCISCRRQDARPCSQPMAPLPEDRVRQAPPFAITGIDHAGPLFCSNYPGEKFYILLFTCAVTRAIHLELVESMSAADTLMALRRFFARRGMCSVIWSDNAKGFVATSAKLLEALGSDGPEWKFIVPRAPWWGGWWERLVGSVKAALRKTVGKAKVTRVELETVLHEVEGCLNSRPITFVGDDLDSGKILSPSLFLLGRISTLSKVAVAEILNWDSTLLGKAGFMPNYAEKIQRLSRPNFPGVLWVGKGPLN